MGSGLLLVVIAIVWVAVLIPMFLSREDHADETKQVARFSRAMRSLARPAADFDPLRLRRNAAVRQAAVRRRRITFSLLGLVVVVGAAAALGYVAVWVAVLPSLVLIVWLALAVRAAMVLPRQVSARATVRPVAETPRGRYVTPTPAWSLKANQEVYDTEVVEEPEYLGATGTDDASWAPVPIPEPRHVRASGVSGEVIARASSWSRSVLNDVRARGSQPQPTAQAQAAAPAVQPSPPLAQRPAPNPNVYLEEDPPTAEIPIIRHAAGA